MLKILDKINTPLKLAVQNRIIQHKTEDIMYIGAYLANINSKLKSYKGELTQGMYNI